MSLSTKASPAQLCYANMLFYGCWSSLALMVITYVLYVSGIITPHVPLEQVTQLWGQRVDVYLAQGNIPTGWGWLALIGQGDFMNFIGIVLLAGMTIICYVPLVFAFIRSKEPIMFWVAVGEIVVLCVAASGIFGSGGH